MIKINLLPEEYRKKKVDLSEIFQKYKGLAIPIGATVIGIVIVISSVVLVYPKIKTRTLNKLKDKWKKIENDYELVMKLKEEEKLLKQKLDSIDFIINNRLIWAMKLNEISDALPPEIQLTEINVTTEKDKDIKDIMLISGIVPSFPGDRAIEKFIKNLKDTVSFTNDFPKIELSFTEATNDGFKQFILKCHMRKRFILEKEEENKKMLRKGKK